MAKFSKLVFLSAVLLTAVFGLLNCPQSVLAATPTLSLSATGSGDNVLINVSGDANTSVILFYNSQFRNLGNTNTYGIFSQEVSSATYGITSNNPVYVKIGGINGTQSSTVNWPYVSSTTTTNSLTLSQSSLLMTTGETSTITASASYLYLLSNSSPTIANINFNASQITVQALTYGTTTAKICVLGSTSNCASIYIVVQTSSVSKLGFSQNNFSLVSGQNVAVTISGGSGNYVVSNNSNPTSIQTSINGSTITLTATGTSGAASITVCTTDTGYCGVINVNATTLTSTTITFSQTSPVVPLGQSTTVTIYGGTGTNFYVSTNSNPSIVQANINNNILTLIGNSGTGNSTITICAYAGTCGSLTAYVSSVSSGGTILLSQSSVSILAGQSTSITISGGSTPYSISSSNSANVFNSVINGNILTIYGVNPGSASASVCAAIGCTNLSVTISSTNSSTNPPTFSQNNVLLTAGQQTTVSIYGTGNYYVSSNSSSSVATISISGSVATVYGQNAGTANISICQGTGGYCAMLYVTVSAATPVTTPVVTPTTPTTTIIYFSIDRYLGPTDNGDDVLKLQKALVKLGLLSATPNGYYGSATTAAVKSFQKQYSIKQTGNVGPSTKSALENLNIVISSSTSSDNSQATRIAELQALIQSLTAQIQALAR